MADSARATFLPVRHQAGLPRDRMIVAEAPDAEALEMDVVIVGAGPAGLACAIELARLVQADAEAGGGWARQIAVLDKARRWASTPLGRRGEPARLPRALPRAQDERLPLPRAGDEGVGAPADGQGLHPSPRRRP
jgi:cation diffusion facilitator CzcD-associated flavoprotein CzcO